MKGNSDIFLLCSFLLLVAGLPLLVLTHINDNLAGEAALAEHCRYALSLIARHASDGDRYCGVDIDRCIYHRSEQRKLESYYDMNCDIQRCPDYPFRCWFSARNTASWVERCVDGNWIYVRSCAEGCGNGKCFGKLVCTDTDGGKEPYTFGVVNATGIEPVYDVCMGSSVHEAYCDEDSLPKHEVFSCPHGCAGGVCMKDTCGNDICDAGETWQTCPLDCSLERTCTDTDAGRDYFTKGTATEISDKQYVFEDLCTGNVLSEGMCSDGVASYHSYACPEECRDGACVAAEDYCYDSDRGFEPYYFGYVNSSVNEYAADYCTGIEDRLAEATCDDDLSSLYKFHTCQLGCIDGACVPDNSTCVEDDNGRNYYVKGTSSGPRRCIYGGKLADCIGGPQEHHDVCVQGGRNPVKFGINPVLNEYYCGYDGRMVLYAYLCPEGCQEGSCVDPCKDIAATEERDHCYLTLVTRDNPGICSLVTSNMLREQCYEEVGKCKDSDGGADYHTKGETVGRGEGLQYEIWFFSNDTCYKDEAPELTQYRNRLKEYKCGPEHELQLVAYDCPNGCEDGACLGTPPDEPEQPEQPTEPSDGSTPSSYNCADTDGGIKPDQYGEVTHKRTSRDDLFRDYCYSGKVTEYYCREEGGWAMTSIDCPKGCEAGACISESACVPSCDGRDCGDDGCGGNCGECPTGQACSRGVCVSDRLILAADSLTPPSQGELTVTIEVETVTSLSGVQFKLDYDSARLTYLGNSAGSFFDSCPVVNDDGDKVSIACIAYGTGGVDGSGEILSLNFLTDGPGPAVLELVDVTAADAMNQGAALVTDPLTVTVV